MAPLPHTAADIAQLYLTVGEQLRTFEQAHGRDASADLWIEFRYIRINEAIADPEQREAIGGVLHRLQDRIAERSR
jgi:hypothetical protein